MTGSELYRAVKATGINCKRLKSSVKLNPPYVVVCDGDGRYEGADAVILQSESNPRLELYTTSDDYSSGETIKQMLIDNNLPFDATDDTVINDEGVYVTYYDIDTQYNLL